jgi:hypothetical protein
MRGFLLPSALSSHAVSIVERSQSVPLLLSEKPPIAQRKLVLFIPSIHSHNTGIAPVLHADRLRFAFSSFLQLRAHASRTSRALLVYLSELLRELR